MVRRFCQQYFVCAQVCNHISETQMYVLSSSQLFICSRLNFSNMLVVADGFGHVFDVKLTTNLNLLQQNVYYSSPSRTKAL